MIPLYLGELEMEEVVREFSLSRAALAELAETSGGEGHNKIFGVRFYEVKSESHLNLSPFSAEVVRKRFP
jgi:hypothetical protein